MVEVDHIKLALGDIDEAIDCDPSNPGHRAIMYAQLATAHAMIAIAEQLSKISETLSNMHGLAQWQAENQEWATATVEDKTTEDYCPPCQDGGDDSPGPHHAEWCNLYAPF